MTVQGEGAALPPVYRPEARHRLAPTGHPAFILPENTSAGGSRIPGTRGAGGPGWPR